MSDKFVRVKEVSEMTGLSRTKIYKMVQGGEFPPQTRISHRVAVWRQSAVESWMRQALPVTKSDDWDLLI